MTPDRWLWKVLASASVALASAAHADPVDLKPFKASYTAEWKGMTAGNATLELRRGADDTYHYTSVNSARGMFRLAFPDALSQTSTFRIVNGAVVPQSFTGSDEKQRPIDLKFDWLQKRLTGTAKERPVDLELPAGAQDPMSLQIESLRKLASSAPLAGVSMVDGDKIKGYELAREGEERVQTALGELDTVVYVSRRTGSDRATRTWVAPALGYLPVKAVRTRGKKTEFTLLIESADISRR
jgi:hypothetical protein